MCLCVYPIFMNPIHPPKSSDSYIAVQNSGGNKPKPHCPSGQPKSMPLHLIYKFFILKR